MVNSLPTYCINEKFQSLVQTRFPSIHSIELFDKELNQLSETSASEFFRSHDLLAYKFLVLTPNPFRRTSCADASLEYIPFVPFYWRPLSSLQTHNMSSMIEDIISFMEWEQLHPSPYHIQRFTVASPFNFRTLMGFGMPTPIRRGYAWDTVSKFVMSLYIGHYERWPQCPDLLRKPWKYVVEIPYVPFNTLSSTTLPVTVTTTNSVVQDRSKSDTRKRILFFAGRLPDFLYGPEQVCSVRQNIASLATYSNSLFINITNLEFEGPIQPKLFQYMKESQFCLVSKSDSYSSSALYHAITAGCVPIVISDWFTFAYPWAIPYEEFVVRVLETDFLINPIGAINRVIELHGTPQELSRMRASMFKYSSYLSFQPLSTTSPEYREVQVDIKNRVSLVSQSSAVASAVLSSSLTSLSDTATHSQIEYSFVPFELMLWEMKIMFHSNTSTFDSSGNEKMYPAAAATATIPCVKPFTCTHTGKSLAELAVKFETPLTDARGHLCKHASRLIGMYKIVYFMQCVRILWPLAPGQLKRYDNNHLVDEEKAFISLFFNGTKISPPYPPLSDQAQTNIVSLRKAIAYSIN